MFAKSYLEIRAPFNAVRAAFTAEPPEAWIATLVRDGSELEGRLIAGVGLSVGRHRISCDGEVGVGRLVPLGGGVALPITWAALDSSALIPRVEADIELAPIGRNLTQLSVNARYQPPLASFGRVLDRALMNRLAEAVVRDFTFRVGAWVTAKTASASQTTDPLLAHKSRAPVSTGSPK